jgi:hypothetical protein
MESTVIALIGALIGIILTNGIKLILDLRTRAERVRDIQTALRAEIRSHLRSLDAFRDDERRRETIALILGEAGYSPFVPSEIAPFVFDAMVDEIHILPGRVIDPVVLYYRQWRALAASIEDMRAAAFAALSQPRKAAVYEDYIGIGVYAAELANDAIEAVTRSLRDREYP